MKLRLISRTHVADVEFDPISGRKLINNYEVIDELGRGVHGKVKLGRNLQPPNQYVAIKIIERWSKRRRLGRNGNHEDKIKKEIAILRKARHANIVSLLEVIDDPLARKVYIVLEFVEMGEVRWRTSAEEEPEIALIEYRKYLRELAGNTEDDSGHLEDERMIEKARRRRERKERRRLREWQRRRNEHSEYWSIEYGGDSDDADDAEDEDDPLSHTTNIVDDSQQQTIGPGDYVAAPSLTSDKPNDTEAVHGDEHDKVSQEPSPVHLHDPWGGPEEPRAPSRTGLEGTMYGAYEPEIARGRTPSHAGSHASEKHIVESFEELPEHFRWVPLMTLSAARSAFRDTVLGLEYLHFQGVIHRDIKPANLLQTSDHHIKISDFGVSYVGRQQHETPIGGDQSESDAPAQDVDEAIELAKTVGTPAFYAPELCQTDGANEDMPVTGAIDVWALGVTLYCLVYGRVPFHHMNTFALMRMIAEEEVHLPGSRLRAVETEPRSRPGSHGRFYTSGNSNKRARNDLAYEEVDETLQDLLKRLLIKNPTRRITLKEVKFHPWVVQDLQDPLTWLDETDPSRQYDGKRIEVSKEDVAEAVVPIHLIERARSLARKTYGAVAGAFGLGKGHVTRRRDRSATHHSADATPTSTASSSSTISQDAARELRRRSVRPDDQIFEALKSSREEHPLSQSLTASPEEREKEHFFEGHGSLTVSPRTQPPDEMRQDRSRPLTRDRAQSVASTSESKRASRPADLTYPGPGRGHHTNLSHELPETPHSLESPGIPGFGGLFGAGRRMMRSVRSRDRSSQSQDGGSRATSLERFMETSDPHGEPSIASSLLHAAGRLDPPEALKSMTPASSSLASPVTSRTPSLTSEHLHPHQSLTPSRQSSESSTTSVRPTAWPEQAYHYVRRRASHMYVPHAGETNPEGFYRAQDEHIRKQWFQERRDRERSPGPHRPSADVFSGGNCPPSPDDLMDPRYRDSARHVHPGQQEVPDILSPHDYPGRIDLDQMVSSSSEGQFSTAISQSTSNPSIPSVLSADSSIPPDDGPMLGYQKEPIQQNPSSEETVSTIHKDTHDDDEGYAGDHAVESGDDEEDSSDGEFITMKKKKKAPSRARSASINNAALARSRDKKYSRSTRSGSSNTVKKVHSYSGSSDEGHSVVSQILDPP